MSDMQSKLQLMVIATRLTLFTRPNCGLCDSAKLVLQSLSKRKHFQMQQIDVMAPGNVHWKMVYEFDTPVVRVRKNGHIGKINRANHI